MSEKMTWREYVRDDAENAGVDFDMAWEIFCVLGPLEAYDGFLTMLEDAADFMEE